MTAIKRNPTIITIAILILLASALDRARTPLENLGLAIISRNDSGTGELFENAEIEAKAFYVYDIKRDKVIYAKNENIPMPLASITKLMTAVVAIETLSGKNNITISSESLKQEGDTGLLVGENWEAKNLTEFTLVTSSNDGADAIAAASRNILREKFEDEGNEQQAAAIKSLKESSSGDYFIDEMNRKAKNLGLNDMRFNNVTGLDENGGNGGYASARSTALLTKYVLENYGDITEKTAYINPGFSSAEKIHWIENTNKSLKEIPGLLLSKTGFTDMAGGNLTVAFDAGIGHPVIVTVLGSTQEGRFKDVKKLAELAILSLEVSGD